MNLIDFCNGDDTSNGINWENIYKISISFTDGTQCYFDMIITMERPNSTYKFKATETPTNPGTPIVPEVTYYDLWVGPTQVTSDNATNVLGDGKVSYDANTNTLKINGASISAIDMVSGIYTGLANTTIIYDGENVIHSEMYGIYSEDSGSTILKAADADAKLTMVGIGKDKSLGIYSEAPEFSIIGGNLNISGFAYGIYSWKGTLNFKDVTAFVTCADYGYAFAVMAEQARAYANDYKFEGSIGTNLKESDNLKTVYLTYNDKYNVITTDKAGTTYAKTVKMIPNASSTSDAPGTSTTPGTSDTPGTSTMPGTSDTPGTSITPGTSEEPTEVETTTESELLTEIEESTEAESATDCEKETESEKESQGTLNQTESTEADESDEKTDSISPVVPMVVTGTVVVGVAVVGFVFKEQLISFFMNLFKK